MPPIEEGCYRDLVGRVERAGERPSAFPCLAREAEKRETLAVGRLELEREGRPRGRATARAWRCAPGT